MAYSLPDNDQDVLRHWQLYKKVLHNTFEISGLLCGFSIKINEYSPFKVRVQGCKGERSYVHWIELLSNGTSLYFRVTGINPGVLFSKRGQAFLGNDNNINLIKDVVEFTVGKFSERYERYSFLEQMRQRSELAFSGIIKQMTSRPECKFSVSQSGVTANVIVPNMKGQIYGTIDNNGHASFSINLRNVCPKKTAQIAQLLSEN